MALLFDPAVYQIKDDSKIEYTKDGEWLYWFSEDSLHTSWCKVPVQSKIGVDMYYLFRRTEIAERALRHAFSMNEVHEGGRALVRLLAAKNLENMSELVDYIDAQADEIKRLTKLITEWRIAQEDRFEDERSRD